MMSLHTYGRTKTAAVPGRGSHCTIQSRASYAYDHAKKQLCLSTWAHPATSADTFVTCCHGAGRLSNLQHRRQQHTVAQETCTTDNTNHINAAYDTGHKALCPVSAVQRDTALARERELFSIDLCSLHTRSALVTQGGPLCSLWTFYHAHRSRSSTWL